MHAVGSVKVDLRANHWWPYDLPLDVLVDQRVAVYPELLEEEWLATRRAELSLRELQNLRDLGTSGQNGPKVDGHEIAECLAHVETGAEALRRVVEDSRWRRRLPRRQAKRVVALQDALEPNSDEG